MRNDTIVASITGPPPAAVVTIRLSGARAWEIGALIAQTSPDKFEDRRATHRFLLTGDDAVILPFTEGHSYTGDQSLEISVHGSSASVRALIEACLNNGARMANPGEFTLRAFMNGRLDLTQAEGVKATVDATTSAQLRAANDLRNGHTALQVKVIRDDLLGALTAVEASTDFSEEIGDLDTDAMEARLDLAIQSINKLLASAPASRIIQQGLTIVVAGQPNAGKSSLLNRLVGYDRAIVTEVPGTTRDTVEVSIEVSGIPCRLIDTAGMRETGDLVERMGIERSQSALTTADFVLYIYDASQGWTEMDRQVVANLTAPHQIIANKSDLAAPNQGLPISCLTGEGLAELLKSISDQLPTDVGEVPLILERHVTHLDNAKRSLEEALATLDANAPDDLLGIDLRQAIRHLGEIIGDTASPDIIDRIFHDFCIGK